MVGAVESEEMKGLCNHYQSNLRRARLPPLHCLDDARHAFLPPCSSFNLIILPRRRNQKSHYRTAHSVGHRVSTRSLRLFNTTISPTNIHTPMRNPCFPALRSSLSSHRKLPLLQIRAEAEYPFPLQYPSPGASPDGLGVSDCPTTNFQLSHL